MRKTIINTIAFFIPNKKYRKKVRKSLNKLFGYSLNDEITTKDRLNFIDRIYKKPKIQNRKKYNKALKNKSIKLNLGCGSKTKDEYLNVDIRNGKNVDLVATLVNLPFKKDSVDEIFSSHVIEHFPRFNLENEIFPYWYSLLKSGGKLVAFFPDAHTMATKYVNGEYDFESFATVTFGGQDYKFNFHYIMFNEEFVTKLLKKAGFTNISFPVKGKKQGLCYEMCVIAEKP
jgi:predicted SAM-dependent methyltransferase